MSLSKLSPECEKCAYVRWCPNKRMVAMMELPLPSGDVRFNRDLACRQLDKAFEAHMNIQQLDLARQRPANLDGIIENLYEDLARFYGVPKCFFWEDAIITVPLMK